MPAILPMRAIAAWLIAPPVCEEAMFDSPTPIVSGFLACVLLVLGGVHNGRLALKIKGVIGHHAVRFFVYDCRAIKKPR